MAFNYLSMKETIMANTEQQIKSDLDAYINAHGGGYRAWYVGISADARERLFTGHSVRENGDAWIFRTASSDGVARRIERHFLDLGCDGGPGGGDDDSNMVYAYRKARHTVP